MQWIDIDVEEARCLYHEEGLTLDQVGKELGVSGFTVAKRMDAADIPRRHVGGRRIEIDVELARHLYWDEELPAREVAKRLGVKEGVVRDRMREANIPIRSISEAVHLQRGNHVDLSPEALSFIEGHLLGDGTITAHKSVSARYTQSGKFREYLEWVNQKLSGYGLSKTGNILPHVRKRKPPYKDSVVYSYSTRAYAELVSLRERWYAPEKQPPTDFVLDPISLLQWYLDDGSYTPPRYRKGGLERGTAKLCNFCFTVENKERLASQIQDMGLSCTVTGDGLRISSSSTNHFFDLIGDCPVDCYRYKWPHDKQLRLL